MKIYPSGDLIKKEEMLRCVIR